MRLLRAHDAQEIAAILNQWNVHYVVAPKPGLGITINPPTLRELVQNNLTPEFQTKWLFVGRIGRQADREPLIVLPGTYDDSDPAIVYKGSWVHDNGWTQAHARTISFSNSPGSEIRFVFQGSSLTYVYTKALNRGIADVVIDGVRRAALDLYSPKAEWQSRTNYKLGTGRHLAVITLLPQKNPKSSDHCIDVDAFEVQ